MASNNQQFQHPELNQILDLGVQLARMRAAQRGGNPMLMPDFQPGQDMAQRFLEDNILGRRRAQASTEFMAKNNFAFDVPLQMMEARGMGAEARQLRRAIHNNAAADVLGQMMNTSPIVQSIFGGNILGAHVNAVAAGGSFAVGPGMSQARNYADVLNRQTVGIRNAQRMTEMISTGALRDQYGRLTGMPNANVTGGYSVADTMNAMTSLQVMGAHTGMGTLHAMAPAALQKYVADQTGYSMGLLRDTSVYSGATNTDEAIAAIRSHAGTGSMFRKAFDPRSGVGDTIRREMMTLAGMGTSIGRGAQGMQASFEMGRMAVEAAYTDPATGQSSMAGSSYARAQGMQAARNVAMRASFITNQLGHSVGPEQMQELEMSEARHQLRQQGQSGTRNVTAAMMVLGEDQGLNAQFNARLRMAVASGDPSRVEAVTRQISNARFGDPGSIGRLSANAGAFTDFVNSSEQRIMQMPGGASRLDFLQKNIASINAGGERAENAWRTDKQVTSDTLSAQRRAMDNAGIPYDRAAGAKRQLGLLKGEGLEAGSKYNLGLDDEQKANVQAVYDKAAAAGGPDAGIAAVREYLVAARPGMAEQVDKVLSQGKMLAQQDQGKEGTKGSSSWNTRVTTMLTRTGKLTAEQQASLSGATTVEEKTKILTGLIKDDTLLGKSDSDKLRGDLKTEMETDTRNITEVKEGGKLDPQKLTASIGDLERRATAARMTGDTKMEAELTTSAENIASEQGEVGKKAAARSKLLNRAAEELITGRWGIDKSSEELAAEANAGSGLSGKTRITAEEINQTAGKLKADVDQLKATKSEAESEAGKLAYAEYVKLAPNTRLILVDGNQERTLEVAPSEGG